VSRATYKAVALVSVEGPVSVLHRASEAGKDTAQLQLKFPMRTAMQIGNDAPSSFSFMLVSEYRLLPAMSSLITGFTVSTAIPNVAISVDASLGRDHFGVDRTNLYYTHANEVAMRNDHEFRLARQQLYHYQHQHQQGQEEGSARKERLAVPTAPTADAPGAGAAAEGEGEGEGTPPAAMVYSIKVIAYNRPDSLARLLQSLAVAQYSRAMNSRSSISLEISIDGSRHSSFSTSPTANTDGNSSSDEGDAALIQRSIEIANRFEWNFGEKR
jgi:hypothetical protein